MNNIEFEGYEELMAELDGIIDKNKANAILKECCALVEGEAKKKAPKDTGELRRSITSKVEDLKGVVFTPLLYAPYVEYGTGLFAENGGRLDAWSYKDDQGNWHKTSGMKPQPYLRPALDECRNDILEMLKGALINND